jgi:hypothetical protein
MNMIILVMLAAVLKLALLIQTFNQEMVIIAAPIQTMIMRSPSHSKLGLSSMIQDDSEDPQVTRVENNTPITQKTSASNIPPAVLAGLKYTELERVRFS